MTKQWNRWRGGGAACVLISMLVLALLAAENALPADDDAKTAALPVDLAKIPSDGLFVFSIRVAELWSSDVLKSARGKYTEMDREAQEDAKDVGVDLEQLLPMAIIAGPPASREFEKRFGLPLQQVERLTLAIVGPRSASHELVMMVRTIKPYDLAKVLAANDKLKREKYNGETVYVADRGAVYPLDDRSLVYSEFPSELRNLIDHPHPKEKGGLTNALERAAEKHAMVYAFNIKQYHDSGDLNQLPPGAEPFRPLSLAHGAMLVADIGAESRLEAIFHFANEKDAKAAVKPAQAGLDLLRASLAGGIKTLDKEKDMTDLVRTLKQLETPLKETRIERKDKTLYASVRAKVDLATAGVVLVQTARKTREANARIESSVNLHQIGIALHMYHNVEDHFPTQATYDKNGKPMLSWRVMLLPYIEQRDLYNQFHFNEPWDSEHNKKLLAKMPKRYMSPQDEKANKDYLTHYQGFVGKGAFFEGKKGITLEAVGKGDGTSNTIMLVEASKAVPWTKPEDIPYDAAKPLPKLGLPGASDFTALFCDGSLHDIAHTIKPMTLRCLITYNDGIVIRKKDF